MSERVPVAVSLNTVGLVVFVNNLGIGLSIPTMPFVIRELANVPLDRAAAISGVLTFCFALTQFVSVPFLGSLSDRIGRRPVLLMSLVALGLDYIILAVAPNLGWLFVGKLLLGLMSATWATANSCVGDAVPDSRRGHAFGILSSFGAAGLVLGPVIGGLASGMSNRAPFAAAAFLALSGAFAVFLRFRETLPPEKRRAFSYTRANPIGSMLRMRRRGILFECLIAIFLVRVAVQSQYAVWAYYAALRFGWGPSPIGLTFTFFGILFVVIQALFLGRAIDRFGERLVLFISLTMGIPAYLLVALAPSPAWAVIGVSVGACGSLAFPAFQKLLATHSADDQHGEVQGAISSIFSLATIVGPPLMTSAFSTFSDTAGVFLPGAPFLIAALLLGAALIILHFAVSRAASASEGGHVLT